jgi:hypothetical protein
LPRGVGDGRSAVCGLLRARESGFGEAPPVAQRAAGAGHARQESHRVAARGRVALTAREARRSPVIDRAAGAKEAVGLYGHSVRLHCKLSSTNAPPRKLPTNLSETSSPQPRARPHARHGDAPLTALRLSGAMGGSRNSGRRVGGGGLGSVRPRPFRAPRCRHGTSAAAAAWISRKRASPPPSTLAADVPPPRPRTRFPRTPTRRVSRARLRATARTSAATTGDTSSRATTATSRISTPTARGVRICAR